MNGDNVAKIILLKVFFHKVDKNTAEKVPNSGVIIIYQHGQIVTPAFKSYTFATWPKFFSCSNKQNKVYIEKFVIGKKPTVDGKIEIGDLSEKFGANVFLF